MKLGDYILASVLGIPALMLATVGPGRVTHLLMDRFGWNPYIEEKQERKVVPERSEERRLALSIDESEVRRTLDRFASLGSRVVGYPGCEEAFRYIEEEFRRIGLQDVRVDSFPVVVPVDEGAELEVLRTGERIPLYCFWPNQVKPPSLPPEGTSGHLIYGGKGTFQELDGKEVEGSIVLMDFGCGEDYLNPRALGAEAIIFYDDGHVTREEASYKFLKVPADVPRFWVEKEHLARLMELADEGAEVRLRASMRWKEVMAKNVYGFLYGSDELMPPGKRRERRRWRDQILVLEAYYDAASVVPALAPGAENACGITALLQVAKALRRHPPKYTVVFLATSAHFEGLSGVNNFLYRHSRKSDLFRRRIPPEERIDFKLFVGLDLSSGDDRVAAFTMGTFYNPSCGTNNYQKNMMAPYAKKFSEYSEELFPGEERFVDAIAPSKRTWKNFMPTPLALDHEAAVFVGFGGISFVTPDDPRERVDTPLDRPEYVDVRALTRQIRTIAGLLLCATHDPDFFVEAKLNLKDQGHSLSGMVYWFNREVNFAVPQDPVPGAIVVYQQPGPNSVAGVRTLMVARTGTEGKEKGRFFFDIMRNTWSNKILAYQLDEYGNITSAPDLGQEGDKSFPITQKYVWWEDEMVEVVFKCRALSLFDIVDSRHLCALDHMMVLGENDAPLQWYGMDYVERQSRTEDKVTLAAVAYAKPGTRVKVLMSTGLFGIRYLLTNAPEELLLNPVNPKEVTRELLEAAKGKGYLVDEGVLFVPAYLSAKDTWVLDDVRMKMLSKYGVRNERLFRLHERARGKLLEARSFLKKKEYSKFVASLREAWGMENRAYPEVKSTANDTVRGIIFYFALLVPFSLFLERLLFGFTDIRRRIAGFAGIFLSVFVVLRFVHPAFKLTNSPYIILLAFIVFAMSVVVVGILGAKFRQEAGRTKRAQTGVHEADVRRLSATAAAISLGISNLRKRKMRTALTAITLILVSFTVLSFTSVRTSIKFYRLPRGNEPPYQGILVRDRAWRGMQDVVLDYIESTFSGRATVSPRAWYLSLAKSERAYIRFDAPETGKHSFAYALLGLTPREPDVTGMDSLLVAGRWFRDGERKVCILPTDMAELVGIGPEDVGRARIRMLGSDYRVVGLIDSDKFNRMRDLDDEKLTPVDVASEAAKMQKEAQQNPKVLATEPFQSFIHLESSNTMILPYEEVRELGGTLRSIAVARFKGDLEKEVKEFVTRIALPVFVGKGRKVTVYTSMGATSISGVGNLIVPVLVAALIVLNTMMGAVYERTREIGIYSSVGLAPVHIAALFMAEAAVFATIGAVVGYLLGQVLALVLSSMGKLGGLSLNYSSLSAVWSTAVVMAMVFLSTLYPAKKAADMSVPDVTRRWEFPEPEGDDWKFEFPFTVSGAEVLGLFAYLARVFESYGESSIGEFLTEDVELSAERSSEGDIYILGSRIWLAPYDLGISQEVELSAVPTGWHGVYRILLHIRRLSGDLASWKRINRRFLNVLRKRFLVWRTVPQDVKERYSKEGEEVAWSGGKNIA